MEKRDQQDVAVPEREHDQPAEGGHEQVEKALATNDDGTLPVGG